MHVKKCIGIAILATFGTASAFADDMFLKFSGAASCGGNIVGDSTDPQHPNEIVVSSYSLGVDAESSWTKGGGASVGKPNPGPLKFTMSPNLALPKLLKCIATGHSAQQAVLTIRFERAGPKTGFVYAKYTFTDLFFTSIDQAATDGTQPPLVAVSAVYKTLKLQEFAKGPPPTSSCFQWDIPAGAAGDC